MAEKPTLGPMLTAASHTDPLWETRATLPGSRLSASVPMYMADRSGGAITPMQFGPATAIPCSSATVRISSCSSSARGPVSVYPPPGTTAALAPRSAAARSALGTRSSETAATTASGAWGSSSMEG